MISTRQKAEIAYLKLELYAAEKGYIISVPKIEARYDRILDMDGKLLRVQVKYASGEAGRTSVKVNLSTNYNGERYFAGYTEDEIDALVVYLPKVDKLCLIPKEVWINKTELALRIEPTKNGQKKKVISYKDYILD